MSKLKYETAAIDESSPSQLHVVFKDALMAANTQDIAEATDALRNIQGQICQLIFRVASDHSVKLVVDDPEVDLNEVETNDLITFLSAIGASCQDVIGGMSLIEPRKPPSQ